MFSLHFFLFEKSQPMRVTKKTLTILPMNRAKNVSPRSETEKLNLLA